MNQTPFPSLEKRIAILAGLLRLSRQGKIGPVFCECDTLKLALGRWPGGVSHMIPPERRTIAWNYAADIVARDGVEMRGQQLRLELHARKMRGEALERKPTAPELRRAEYLVESGKL